MQVFALAGGGESAVRGSRADLRRASRSRGEQMPGVQMPGVQMPGVLEAEGMGSIGVERRPWRVHDFCRMRLGSLLIGCTLIGCTLVREPVRLPDEVSDTGPAPDTSPDSDGAMVTPDGEVPDAAMDASTPDATEVRDGSTADASMPDGATPDSATPDAAQMDGSVQDGSTDSAQDAAQDATPADVGIDTAPDASLPCSGDADAIRLDLVPEGPLPPDLPTDCGTVAAESRGSLSRGTPTAVDPPGPVRGAIYLAAANNSPASLILDFGRSVRDLSFRFEWLSHNPASGYDERLSLRANSFSIVPSLSMPIDTSVTGLEVRSMAAKGDGTLTVDRVQRLEIILRNHGVDGVGVEFHSFQFRYE